MSVTLTDSVGNPLNFIDGHFSATDFDSDDFVTDDYSLDIIFTKVNESVPNREVLIYYPSGSINPTCYDIQNLYKKCRTFNVEGKILILNYNDSQYAKEYFKNDIIGTTGSIYGTNISSTSIFYNKVTFSDDEKEPLVIGFNFELIEII